MFKYAIALLSTAFLIAPAHAVQFEWEGGFCITTATAACVAAGWNAGNCLSMRYSPPNVGTNGVQTKMSLFSRNFALSHTRQSGTLIGTTLQSVNVVSVGRSGGTFTSTMRITSQDPVFPTATTNFINLVGNISTWDQTLNCTIGFRATGARRP